MLEILFREDGFEQVGTAEIMRLLAMEFFCAHMFETMLVSHLGFIF